jgi:tungstate transport system substrate-binding protein
MKKSKIYPIIVSLCLLACHASLAQAAESQTKVLRLATTTSTENSGLLRDILPLFEAKSGYQVHVIAVGTGKALKLGQNGDVDVVLVHAPAAEAAFVKAGYGVDRHAVMYNDFVILGPANDPAGVRKSSSAADAMRRIATQQSVFVSRGDDSGTNKKERKLWQAAGVKPAGDWYREAGQGMGKVLQISGELSAYTLTDRGTWLAFSNKLPLQIVFEGDPALFNPYGVIAVNPKRYPDINYAGATTFINWLTSAQGQARIGAFRVAGKQLFIPNANSDTAQAGSKPKTHVH